MIWWEACYIINHSYLIVSKLVKAHKRPIEYPLHLMQATCWEMQNGLPENLVSVSFVKVSSRHCVAVLKVCGQRGWKGLGLVVFAHCTMHSLTLVACIFAV